MATGVVKHGRIGDFAVARRRLPLDQLVPQEFLTMKYPPPGADGIVLITGDQDGLHPVPRACIRAVPVVGDSHQPSPGDVLSSGPP